MTNQKTLFLSLLLCCTYFLSAQSRMDKPKVVVGIVIDQMRQDYLARFYTKLSEDGFKRILREGYEFKNAHYNYKATSTGPGHASIYTGTTPSRHGIVSNSWYKRDSAKIVNCVSDPNVEPLGGSKTKGYASPHRLTTTTMTDELRLISNHQAKVVGISFKDRGAILPAGHNPTGAYWYDRSTGDFVSSNYYMEKLPDWLIAFNQKKLAQQYAQKQWNTLLPKEQYTESIADDNPYERIKWRKENPTLPYDLSNDRNPIDRFTGTPFANQMLTDLAIASIEGEQMGRDAVTDFLAISYSSTDIAGHAMGPRAVEIQDIYLRLDQDMARLLKHLDQKVGKGNYLIFITADHGVVDIPAYLTDNKYPGGRFPNVLSKIKTALNEKYSAGDWILNATTGEIYLNRPLIAARRIDLAEIQQYLADLLLQEDFIHEALTATTLAKRSITDPYVQLLQNSYHTKRSADVLMMMESGYLMGEARDRGTSHGSAHTYDTNIPIIFFGTNVPSGSSVRRVHITDIAPTVSMLLEMPLPSRATGLPLLELFK